MTALFNRSRAAHAKRQAMLRITNRHIATVAAFFSLIIHSSFTNATPAPPNQPPYPELLRHLHFNFADMIGNFEQVSDNTGIGIGGDVIEITNWHRLQVGVGANIYMLKRKRQNSTGSVRTYFDSGLYSLNLIARQNLRPQRQFQPYLDYLVGTAGTSTNRTVKNVDTGQLLSNSVIHDDFTFSVGIAAGIRAGSLDIRYTLVQGGNIEAVDNSTLDIYGRYKLVNARLSYQTISIGTAF